ncbi:ATP-binding protein [Dendrosporobacter sp. 1207_IL3150]|uniref:ATP-binding protein n=1 Tax=Dendrosporobacter sp. 1207_IL3150 TaxID=3084054 RepID=UPI002FDB1E1B
MNNYHNLIRHHGVEPLFHAIEMSVTAICNDHPLHLHTEGLRGTGKTTALRAARDILPPITRIKDCVYNCFPSAPHCPLHRNLSQDEITKLGTEIVPRPFLEISHSAKPGSIVGCIDLAKLTDPANSVAALLPGTIPQAHRGIIFIDEINRLADTSPEIADILLDVMGTKPGRIQIEEPGLPTVEINVCISIWAASNPDEEPGQLRQIRRQLSDRFDLTVPVSQPTDQDSIVNILKGTPPNHLISNNKPFPISSTDTITITDNIRSILADIYVKFKLESLRAIKAVETSACLEAVLSLHNCVTIDHIIRVIPNTLGHRADEKTINEILKYLTDLKNGSLRTTSAAALPVNSIENKITLPREAWWKKWLRAFASKLKINHFNQEANSSSYSNKESQANNMKVVKPAETTITAPPTTAAPLSSLADEKLITYPTKHDD